MEENERYTHKEMKRDTGRLEAQSMNNTIGIGRQVERIRYGPTDMTNGKAFQSVTQRNLLLVPNAFFRERDYRKKDREMKTKRQKCKDRKTEGQRQEDKELKVSDSAALFSIIFVIGKYSRQRTRKFMNSQLRSNRE